MQRLALKWRRAGVRVGLVPTMGYLHAGHLSLVRRARRAVGRSGQGGGQHLCQPHPVWPAEDLASYPRDLTRDVRLCRAAGVDVLFAPADAEMYPRPGGRALTAPMSSRKPCRRGMEGASRPTHFRGVTTVVAKLFNIVQPDVAVFGRRITSRRPSSDAWPPT